MSEPTIPRPVTPDEARRDRDAANLARQWSAAHVTPDEARDGADDVMLGVGLACLFGAACVLVDTLFTYGPALAAAVTP